MEYADVIYGGLSEKNSQYLQRLQNRGSETILHMDPCTPTEELHKIAGLEYLNECRKPHICTHVYSEIHQLSTPCVSELFVKVGNNRERVTGACACSDLTLPNYSRQICRKSTAYRGPCISSSMLRPGSVPS